MNHTESLLNADMMQPIEPELVQRILSAKPFYQIDGGFNTRDLSDHPYTTLKAGYAFRSGSLERLTVRGQRDLMDLGVKTVFDLRSPAEVAAFPDPNIEGINIIVASTETNYRHKDAVDEGFDDLAVMYLNMLQTYRAGYQKILKHIRDCPDRSFLLHCTGMVELTTFSPS